MGMEDLDLHLTDEEAKAFHEAINYEPEMSEIEARIDRLVAKWEWVIGGVVDENPSYVRAIIHDFLNVPLPKDTYRSRDGMDDAYEERKKQYWRDHE